MFSLGGKSKKVHNLKKSSKCGNKRKIDRNLEKIQWKIKCL